jgi:competence protein ComEC
VERSTFRAGRTTAAKGASTSPPGIRVIGQIPETGPPWRSAAGASVGVGFGELVRVPLWAGVGLGVVSLVRRWPAVLGLALALLALALTQRSLAGLTPLPDRAVRGEITLVTDPVPTPSGSVRAEARWRERRVALVAHQAAASTLATRLAGERIVVVGDVGPPSEYDRRMLHRHLAGRLQVTAVVGWRPGHGLTRVANGLRRTLERGAASLPDRERSLLMGLTLGDDRAQPPDLVASFRAAGLTHLTAVSGQNIAFVLVLAAPALRRVSFGPRLVLTLGLLAGFALLTRAEPSVLRATAMAMVVAFGAAVGRPVSALRALGLGVTAVLLCDPLLVTSLGFQLSVLATLAIVVGATPLSRRLPGPRWLALPLAVTVAAQLGVAPLLITSFGPVNLVSLPANLLAVPAAGPLMVWGLTAGLVAGVAGEPFATLLHLPSRLLLTWIEGVATAAGRVPIGTVGLWQWALLMAAAAALVASVRTPRQDARPADAEPDVTIGHVAGRRERADAEPDATIGLASSSRERAGAGTGRSNGSSDSRHEAGWQERRSLVATALRVAGSLGVVAVLVTAVLPGSQQPARAGEASAGAGLQVWRATGATLAVIDGRVTETALVSAVHAAGPSRLDVLIVRTDARRAATVAAAARHHWPRVVVLAPALVADRLPGAATPPPGSVVDVGDLRIRFDETSDTLRPTVDRL